MLPRCKNRLKGTVRSQSGTKSSSRKPISQRSPITYKPLGRIWFGYSVVATIAPTVAATIAPCIRPITVSIASRSTVFTLLRIFVCKRIQRSAHSALCRAKHARNSHTQVYVLVSVLISVCCMYANKPAVMRNNRQLVLHRPF